MPVSTKEITVNMGPQHPSTHGVLRLILELDGEVVVSCTPHIGFLHRGSEKLAENLTYQQIVPLTDRFDYLSCGNNNLAYAMAVEKLMGIEVPERADYLRTLVAELSRLSSHLLWLATHALDIGAMTVCLYCLREREGFPGLLIIHSLCSIGLSLRLNLRPCRGSQATTRSRNAFERCKSATAFSGSA